MYITNNIFVAWANNAKAAGIDLNLNDGWGDLMELATRHKTTNEINN